MSHDCHPVPLNTRFLTRGVWALIAVAALGLACGVYRFFFGLSASTNLDQSYPWGIWIVVDVTFIALAAGGFTTAAITYVFRREDFEAVARPALLTALLGYTFACVALAADLGKYYNIWHPILPSMWQGNSALFEVGMCVMCYLTVLYIEFLPVACERFMNSAQYPRLARICGSTYHVAERTKMVFIILGVCISCLHQSSLGHIMVLVPTKLHPLWHTPILAWLFLSSAIAVGFPTVIFVSLCSSWAFRMRPPMALCQALARYAAVLLSVYLGFKVWDILARKAYVHLFPLTFESGVFLVEVALFLVAAIMLASPRVRSSAGLLAMGALMAMLGVVVNRTNVYLIGYRPPFADHRYVPSLAEWGLTIGILAALVLLWRAIAIHFPILAGPTRDDTPLSAEALRSRAGSDGKTGRRRIMSGVTAVLALTIGTGIAQGNTPESEEPMQPQLAVPATDAHMDATSGACRECHFCARPTPDHPCLLTCPRSRPRSEPPAPLPDQGPETVSLNELEKAYSPVPFDHAGHAQMAEMAGGCVICHHYTPVGERHPACKTCHPVSSAEADVDKPALLGAYHQRCLNCHREWINEKDCAMCHEKKAGGAGDGKDPTISELLGLMHAPVPEPEGEMYRPSCSGMGSGQVIFRHRDHTRRFGLRCVECHHEAGCKRCHASQDIVMEPRTVSDHHQPCVRCHKNDMLLSAWKADRCDRCHWREGQPKPDAFDHASTGWPLKRYHREKSCRACHENLPFRRLSTSCESCHETWDTEGFDHAVTGQTLDDNHAAIDCETCHPGSRFDTAPTCEECHEPDDDEPITFPARRPGPVLNDASPPAQLSSRR